MKKYFLKPMTGILILLFSCNVSLYAQSKVYDTTTANFINEITALQGVYYNTPYYSFDVTYYMTDVDTITAKDTMYAKYKINGDSMNIMVLGDTIISIQNANYFGTIYNNNRSIVVQQPVQVTTKNIFQVDVSDSVFQNLAMNSITNSDSSGATCYRRVNIVFDSNAVYKDFKIVYCKNTNKISYITYTVKKDPAGTKYTNMYVAFTNYAQNAYGSSVFSTDPYFIVNSPSDIKLAPGMDSAYEIINLLQQ